MHGGGAGGLPFRFVKGWDILRHTPEVGGWRLLGKLWGTASQVGWQSYAQGRWHQAHIHLSGQRVGDPAEPRDGRVTDRKIPMEHDNEGVGILVSFKGVSFKGAAVAAAPFRSHYGNSPHAFRNPFNPQSLISHCREHTTCPLN